MPRTRILSVDVFDTTLTRLCGSPIAAYLWLGRSLGRSGLIAQSPEAFARARIRAEQVVWRRAGSMDAQVYLEDFYGEVAEYLWLDHRLIPQLVDAELQLEERLLRPIPSTLRLVEKAAAEGQSIVFISDTYFPRGFIERQLRVAGVPADAVRCFASCDWSRSKASGLLFDTLIEETGGAPDDVLHVGDNPHSDIRVPRRKGLRTRWLQDGLLTRYERLLAEHMWETSGLAAGLAGASRQARLHTPADDPHQAALRDVAAGVAAPIIVGYVLWVLHRAQDLGLRRLYFLARDGEIMAKVAERLVARLGLDIEVSYLYVSRLSTNLAATFDISDEETGWVFRDREFLSPHEILDRFGLSWDEAAPVLEPLGVCKDFRPTPPAMAEAIDRALRSSPLRDIVLDRARDRRSLVQAYLAQEGVMDDGRCGIIDFGGVGSQVRALHVLISDAGASPPQIFLVGIDRPEDAGLSSPPGEPQWLRDTECYLYDHRRDRGIKRFRGLGTCMQMFCAADHDTVTGYRREGDRVVPVLDGDSADLLEAWGLPTVWRAIVCVAEQVVLDDDLVDRRADLRAAACEVIQTFWTTPTADEAAAWGAFPFEGAQAADSKPRPLAHAYSWPHVLAGLARRTFPDLGWQHWHEASVRLSPPLLRTLLGTAERSFLQLNSSTHPLAQRAAGVVRRVLDR